MLKMSKIQSRYLKSSFVVEFIVSLVAGVSAFFWAFLFASEIKSLVKGGLIEAECNNEAVFEYFLFRHISGENSLFKGAARRAY